MHRSFARITRVLCVAPLWAFVAPLPAAPATAPATAPAGGADTPGGLLASKGLDKSGTMYVLRAEKDMAAGLREITVAKKAMDEEIKARAAIEKQIKIAKNVFSKLDLEYRNLNEQLAGAKGVAQNNQIVGKLNATASKLKEARTYQDDQQLKLSKIGEEKKTKYINLILDAAVQNEKANEAYKAVGADPAVKAAAEQLKAKLGPSPEFVAGSAQIKRLRGLVTADTIDIEMDGGVPHVQVTLNGSHTRTMVFDSGASIIALPAAIAKSIELVPAADDPMIEITLADGKRIKAQLTKLKSVRVGSFTVEDVACAILPADLVAAEALLGGSFLSNFTYKLDPVGKKLHLAQVGGAEKPGPKPAAK